MGSSPDRMTFFLLLQANKLKTGITTSKRDSPFIVFVPNEHPIYSFLFSCQFQIFDNPYFFLDLSKILFRHVELFDQRGKLYQDHLPFATRSKYREHECSCRKT